MGIVVRDEWEDASDEGCAGAQSILPLGGASREHQPYTGELASLPEGTADVARPLIKQAS